VRLAAFEPPRLNDGATRELMEKVSVSVDPELDATFPRQRAARVAITARGRREELVQPTRKAILTFRSAIRKLEEKFMELAAPVIGNPARGHC